VQAHSYKNTSGIAADLTLDLGPATLYYLGSHRSYDHDQLANFYYRVQPALALNVRESFLGDYTQNSHELRVATNGDGPFSAQAGLYYFREESSQLHLPRPGPDRPAAVLRVRSRSDRCDQQGDLRPGHLPRHRRCAPRQASARP
jgi:hypothetical protein